jgi:SAM-dependent methyltransferase
VNQLLEALPPGALILDLGCGAGSFLEAAGSTVAHIDLEIGSLRPRNFVQADAAQLPFREHCFDLIVSNHSLEHFENLRGALGEIERVIKADGALYVSVPDATTFCDRLYRWLSRGGGHVNAFASAPELAAQIQRATGLKHIATRTLCTSLSFLNRRNAPSPRPRRLWLLGDGTEPSLRLISYLSRLSVRLLHTRLSVYGWEMYFGNVVVPIDCHVWINVCIRCGSGHPSAWLLSQPGVVRRRWVFRGYSCPGCGAWNLFTDDESYREF